MRKVLFAATTMLAAIACGPGGTTDMDAGMEAGTPPADARPDTAATDTRPASTPGNPCTTAAMCMSLGTGASCDQRWPGGFCNKRCTSDRACGEGFVCVAQMFCARGCTTGGQECGGTEVCSSFDSTRPEVRGCLPSCFQMPASGSPACNSGTTCNPYSGLCEAMFMDPPGAANGAGCANDDACKSGRCIAERDEDGMFSGYLGGLCFSTARTPADSEYQLNRPLPRSNCPAGSVAIPAIRGGGEGDIAICLKECRMSSDCGRAGYECQFLEQNGMRTQTGFCDTINCLAAPYTTMPNSGCPMGTTCVRQMMQMGQTTAIGLCTPMAGGGDAGMGGGDAGMGGSEAGTMTDASQGGG